MLAIMKRDRAQSEPDRQQREAPAALAQEDDKSNPEEATHKAVARC